MIGCICVFVSVNNSNSLVAELQAQLTKRKDSRICPLCKTSRVCLPRAIVQLYKQANVLAAQTKKLCIKLDTVCPLLISLPLSHCVTVQCVCAILQYKITCIAQRCPLLV